MNAEIVIGMIAFALLSAVSFASASLYPRLRASHRDDETNTIVRLVANIFVVMTSLVFGLMLNSSKNTFETIDSNVHTYATQLILFDRSLEFYGSDTGEVRSALVTYVEHALTDPSRADDTLQHRRTDAEERLSAVGTMLNEVQSATADETAQLSDLRQQYRQIVEHRWMIVEQQSGAIPTAIIGMLIAWLAMIFASFGYRAPKNAVVLVAFNVAALLMAFSIYLVLDMDSPFSGLIQISDAPLHRALAEMLE
ncbi:DUF4239 domain-containing protein [Aliirhizobium terrae]|uniref:bestrophin-like domain n=1 Tax=Terrirhizobium terrae TaxID=2926709 RepID=UPI002574F42B|nr:DUF4239 domain-containing protein [Rhizobium sp. CC-CFT758]WJH39863.1 DUF4239 domain-containing protein [Rhizobium sp. CC-CFT758]